MRTLPELIPLDLLMKSEPVLMKKLAIVGTVSLVFLAGGPAAACLCGERGAAGAEDLEINRPSRGTICHFPPG